MGVCREIMGISQGYNISPAIWYRYTHRYLYIYTIWVCQKMVNLKWFNAPVVTLMGNMIINHQILGYHNSWNPCFDVIYLMDSFKNTCAYAWCRYYMIWNAIFFSRKKRSIVSVDMMPSIKLAEKNMKKRHKHVSSLKKWVPKSQNVLPGTP